MYRLLPNYADVFMVNNRNSTKSIFEVQSGRGTQVGTGNPVTSFFFQQFAPAELGTIVTGVSGSNGEDRMVPTNNLLAAYEPRRWARGNTPNVLPDLSGLDQAGLREAIWRERRTELALEGHRWFDLTRTGRAVLVISHTKPTQARSLLLPLPQRERDLNRNLSQNQGY